MGDFLGIDNGGTRVKAAVFDEKGRELSAASFPLPSVFSREGFAERDMEQLWEINCRAVRRALELYGKRPNKIKGISFSGHGKGLYLTDESDRPVRPGILSADSRAWEYTDKWKKLGLETIPCQPVCLLKWLQEHEPETLERAKWIFGVKDYIRFRLTGRAAVELTDFSASGLLDLKTGRYSREILEKTGLEEIREKLPEILRPEQEAGAVSRQAAMETGIPEGTFCSAGLFDIDACAAGMGLSDSSRAAVLAGTWGITEYLTKEPDRRLLSYQNSISYLPGMYLAEKSSPTSASNFEWAVKTFLYEKWEKNRQPGETIYDFAARLAADVPAGKQKILYFPFLFGKGNRCAGFLGISAGDSMGEWIRSVMEGIAFYHRYQLEALFQGKKLPEAVRFGGGAANSKFWVQMFADIYRIPIELSVCRESGALGAAMAAAAGCREYRDIAEAMERMTKVCTLVEPERRAAEIYGERYEEYKNTLEEVWKERR